MKNIQPIALCLTGCLAMNAAFGATLVRLEFQYGIESGVVDLKLYEDAAPLSVENFLHYVNGTTPGYGSYDTSFVHRVVPNFVVQGGGYTFDSVGAFTYDSDNDLYPGGLQPVEEGPLLINEAGISNLTGTIAMATKAGDINSGTSQWFINLVDNLSLDSQSFAVFGEVLGNGMTVMNSIAALPLENKLDIHPAFGEIPLVNYTSGEPVGANLVWQSSSEELLKITPDIDFGPQLLNTSEVSVITITNNNAQSLSIGAIADTDTVSAPFEIVSGSDTCSNTDLTTSASCNLTIRFTPPTEDVFSDSFNIEFTNLSIIYSFPLAGTGATVVEPNITSTVASVDFGEQPIYDESLGFPEQIVVSIFNEGNIDLNISAVTLEGPGVDAFQFIDNCTQFGGPVIEPGAFCVMPVNFIATTVGDKVATLTVFSDDPDEPVLEIPVTATASIDVDGVSSDVEDAAPNNGDGNNDGILDSIQSNVASLPGRGGEYMTLVSEAGITIRTVSMLSDAQLVNAPDNVEFGIGIFEFEIGNAPPWPFNIGLILPEGMIPASYYKYAPTPDDINPHWYEFVFDGDTGAEFLGDATLTSPSGNVIRRSLVRLWFEDGQRGDADLTLDGTIVDPGGPEVSADARIISSSSGSLSAIGIFLFILVIFGVRAYRTEAACTRIEQRELMHSTRKSL